MTRRTFTKRATTAAGAAAALSLMAGAGAAAEDTLQSEFLLDLLIDTQPPNTVGPDRMIVPVSGGTFEGPRLNGTIVGPSGDWIIRRPDGSLVLDIRLVLQTNDEQKIFLACRGVSFTPPDAAQYARILPMFETGAAKYTWLNNLVAVGVRRMVPGKVGYRVYRIL